jgi:hypothetical protein
MSDDIAYAVARDTISHSIHKSRSTARCALRHDAEKPELKAAHLLSLFREWNNPDQPEQQMIEFLNRVPDGFCA